MTRFEFNQQKSQAQYNFGLGFFVERIEAKTD